MSLHLFSILASIPSPSFREYELGPLTLRFYGLLIGIAVIAGIWIATHRWVKLGGHSDDVSFIALIAVPAGLWGAKVYHVITSPEGKTFVDIFKVWDPGLGIPGGLVFGIIAGLFAAKKKNISVPKFLHAAVPAILIAQAIGRFGNWFNQELFGRPSELPWALEISEKTRSNLATQYESFVPYAQFTTFHPTFLYEALWNVGLFVVLITLDRMDRIKTWQMLPAYLLGYGLGRFWVESLRIDDANEIFGLVRVNTFTSFLAVSIGFVLLFLFRNNKSIQEI